MVPSSGYRHSKSFSALKATREQIEVNLTTSQYLRSLDVLLARAAAPLLRNSSFLHRAAVAVAGWQEENFRRKVSFHQRVDLPKFIFAFLLSDDPEAAYSAVQFDRGIRLMLIRQFLSDCELVLEDWAAANALASSLDFESVPVLLSSYREALYWWEAARAFKERIAEKFIRLTLNAARSDYVSFFDCKQVDLDDMIHVYLAAMSRAIDKCDAERGALTSHIQNWYLSARAAVAQSRDTRASSPILESFEGNQSVFADADSPEDLETKIHQQHLTRYLCRLADPSGVARIHLGVGEFLFPSEIQLLENSLSCPKPAITPAPTAPAELLTTP